MTGAAGMLGLDVLRAGERAGWELVGLTRGELDITDAGAVGDAFARVGPDAALNCAAWTDVDGAEAHPEQAHAVNADGAGNLARAAAQAGVPLLHVSTDYVFDGEACVERVRRARVRTSESDPTGPAIGLRPEQARGRAPGAGRLAASHGRAQLVAVRDGRCQLRRDDAQARRASARRCRW